MKPIETTIKTASIAFVHFLEAKPFKILKLQSGIRKGLFYISNVKMESLNFVHKDRQCSLMHSNNGRRT